MKMKKFQKLSAAAIALALCLLLTVTAWAANSLGVTYKAALDDATLCVSDQAQTVKLTVTTNKEIEMDSFTAQVNVPEGLTLTGIANKTLNFTEELNYNLANGSILWYSSDAENVKTDLLAVITITVPANTPVGEYQIDFVIGDISKDYGNVWEQDVTVSATLTVSNHADGDDNNHDCDNCNKANVDNGHHGGTATCMAEAVCEECHLSYGSTDPNNHSYTNYVAHTPGNGYETAACDHGCGKTDTRLKSGYLAGGQCGDNLYWELTTDGTMTISGTGEMWHFGEEPKPWLDYQWKIKKLIIEEGATSIGTEAFRDCGSLETVSFPTTLKTIGYYSFDGCNLSNVVIPEGVTTIEAGAFNCSMNMGTLSLPSTLETIGDNAFTDLYLSGGLVIPAGVTSIGKEAFSNWNGDGTITFLGNAPTIGEDAFGYVTATCYYPVKNATWTAEVMLDYGGDLTWVINCKHESSVYHAKVDATCVATGTIEYWYCPNCEQNFSNKACTAVVTDLTIAIVPNNHAWGEPAYTINDDGTHTATYTCGNDASHTKSETNEHAYDNGECVCGAIENITVVSKGVSTYTVKGNVVTVTYDIACKVGYWSETDEEYIAIPAVANANGSYSFTAPEGVTEVVLVVKGDVNGDGKVNLADRLKLSKSLLSHTNENYSPLEEEWQIFAADVTGDGEVNLADRLALSKSLLSANNANYQALSW